MQAIAVERPIVGDRRYWWHGRAASWVRALVQRIVLAPFVRVLCRSLRIDGAERVRGVDGPAIFVANHSSHFDTVLVLRALPADVRRRVTVAAAKDYFYGNAIKGAATSLLLNTFPFDRGEGAQASLGATAALIREGWSVLLFPEGTRSTDGSIGRFKRGVGALAADTGAPVVPIALEGARDLMAKGRCIPKRSHVRVTFGEPAAYTCTENPIEIANDVRARVVALIGE
jgi:1-acyl-sn-glycerol-3-phosphate acyltransferase